MSISLYEGQTKEIIGIQTDQKETGAPGPYSVGSDCKT